MDSLKASLVIRAPPQEVYDFLVDFTSYGQYSDYIDSVQQRGGGGVGTEYGIRFEWWVISYTAWSRVTTLDQPTRINWEIVKDIDAHGSWELEPTDDGDTRVTLTVRFDPDSANGGALSLPPLVSMSMVVKRAKPVIIKEAKRVLARVVAAIEGDSRPLDVTLHEKPSSI